MMNDIEHIQYRISCIYRKLGEVSPKQVTEVPAQRYLSNRGFMVFQDFRGGMSDDEIRQLINQTVFEIAHIKDLLKNWLANRGRDKNIVERFIDQHEEIKVTIDLANVDKHGYPLSKPRSRHSPQLGEVGRPLQLRTGAEPGSGAVLMMDPRTGHSRVTGIKGGRGEIVFTGDVLDKSGNRIGDVLDFSRQAVRAWERLLSDLGIG